MISCSNALTLLHLAAEDGNAEFLEMLLNVSIDASIVCLQKLFNVSIDVNVRRNDNGFTPLHYAARLGHEDCVRLLIAKRGDVNSQNLNHVTPLHGACCTESSGIKISTCKQ
jgi:ankyrin repeat protein